jgi:uncharacterized membrane protein HdeD (DUF308 family)
MGVQVANGGEPLTSDIAALVQAHWRRFLLQGAVMIGLGVLAAVLPVATTLAVELLIGWLFVIGGVWRGVWLVRSSRMPGFGWSLAMAVVSVMLGILLLTMPLAGMLTLTMLLVAFLVLEAIGKIFFALDLRRHSHQWGWILAAGILNLLLAGLIFAGWPSTAAWAIGLLVAINMVVFGVALVVISLTTGNAKAGDA